MVSAQEATWLAVAILVPLAVNPWAAHPFDLFQAALLRTLVWTMTGVALIGIIRNPASAQIDPRLLKVLTPAFLLGLCLLLSTVRSVDVRISLHGSLLRAQGIFTESAYLLLLIVASAGLRRPQMCMRLIHGMVLTALPIVALGTLQALGVDPLRFDADPGDPLYATLGRSNFVGAYLALLLPLTVGAAWRRSHRPINRLLLWGLVAAELTIIVWAGARGAMLAAVAGLWMLFLFAQWPRINVRARIALLLCAVGIVVVVLALVFWLNRAGGSTAARLVIWQSILPLIGERPLLGHGLETLPLILPAVSPPTLIAYEGAYVSVDRAHNVLLDRLVTTGALGTLAWLALLLMVYARGLRLLSQTPSARGTDAHWAIALSLAGISANLVNNLVSFDVTGTATANALLMAIVVATVHHQPGLSAPVSWRVTLPRALRSLSIVLVTVAIVALVVQLNVRPVVADLLAQRADRLYFAGDLDASIATADRARVWNPAPEMWVLWSKVQFEKALTTEERPGVWAKSAEESVNRAVESIPLAATAWTQKGDFYLTWAMRWDRQRLHDARRAYAQALSLAPTWPHLHLSLGEVDALLGNPEQAVLSFQRATALDLRYGLAYIRLGNTQLALGRVHEAIDAFERAIQHSPHSLEGYYGLIEAHLANSNRFTARDVWEQARQRFPSNARLDALGAKLKTADE
jgi:O-antigen ligase/tetratricopeptide (TPR) repeat protein